MLSTLCSRCVRSEAEHIYLNTDVGFMYINCWQQWDNVKYIWTQVWDLCTYIVNNSEMTYYDLLCHLLVNACDVPVLNWCVRNSVVFSLPWQSNILSGTSIREGMQCPPFSSPPFPHRGEYTKAGGEKKCHCVCWHRGRGGVRHILKRPSYILVYSFSSSPWRTYKTSPYKTSPRQNVSVTKRLRNKTSP